MKNELVSVIIPVYGTEEYLDRCIESVIAQTYPYLEIILVDDGSPDNCPAMCDAWAKKDKRIRVIHKANGGLTSARKAGFETAKGEYIIFFDSDDYVEENMIEELVNKALATDKDITMCSYYRDTADEMIPVFMGYQKGVIEREELPMQFILPIIRPMKGDPATNAFMWTKLYKTTKIRKEYFVSEREYYTEDVLFNTKIALHINGIARVNKPLYHYCENRESLTFKYRENKFEMWNKRTAWFENYFRQNGWLEAAADRLITLHLVSLIVGADNEVIKNDEAEFKSKCQYFKQTVCETGCFQLSNMKYLNHSQKLSFLFYYFNRYGALYKFRKKRVGV